MCSCHLFLIPSASVRSIPFLFFIVPIFQGKEKAMAPHSSTLALKIPWVEDSGGLQSMGSRRVGHDWATSLSLFTFMHWRRKWQPTPVFLPGESQGWGSLVGCRLWGRRVGHDWSDLAAVTGNVVMVFLIFLKRSLDFLILLFYFTSLNCSFKVLNEIRYGFLISPCYSLEFWIQMGIFFLFSFACHASSFVSYL